MKQIKQRGSGAEKWGELLAKFAGSGLSVRAFCSQEGINGSTFNWWRSRLKGGSRMVRSAPTLPSERTAAAMPAGAFVDLGNLSAPAAAAGERLELRLDLGGGVILHLVRG